MTTPIIDLDTAKSQLRITSANSDTKLQMYVDAVAEVVQFYCGDLVGAQYTEVHDGGDPAIYLRHTPVKSIINVTEYIGNIVYTLTNQPPGASVDAWGYSLDDPESGRLVRRTASGMAFRFVPGYGNVNVTYTTGVATIPAAVRLAAGMIIDQLWQSQRGPQPLPLQAGEGDVVVPGVNYAIPMEAVELLKSAARMPVIG
jgi:hypothetical protein